MKIQILDRLTFVSFKLEDAFLTIEVQVIVTGRPFRTPRLIDVIQRVVYRQKPALYTGGGFAAQFGRNGLKDDLTLKWAPRATARPAFLASS